MALAGRQVRWRRVRSVGSRCQSPGAHLRSASSSASGRPPSRLASPARWASASSSGSAGTHPQFVRTRTATGRQTGARHVWGARAEVSLHWAISRCRAICSGAVWKQHSWGIEPCQKLTSMTNISYCVSGIFEHRPTMHMVFCIVKRGRRIPTNYFFIC